MKKQELISKIAQDTGITKANAAAAVDSFFEGITKSLKKGKAITFVGFGTFKTAQRPSRLVGTGRLELPTSCVSSRRSNQLSYAPMS